MAANYSGNMFCHCQRKDEDDEESTQMCGAHMDVSSCFVGSAAEQSEII